MPGRVGPIERHGEKEPQRRDGGVDNRRARAVLGQAQLETTEILIGRRVWRSSEEFLQFHNRANVVVLWVFDAKWRTLMSSIMRRRTG